MPPKILIFGFGYTANVLAKKLVALDFHVVGTSRNQEFLEWHNKKGFEIINFTKTDIEKALISASHILVSTPPSTNFGDPVLAHFVDLIKKYARMSHWLGYLSSTGVYGDHQGGWVDELSASLSLGQQAMARLRVKYRSYINKTTFFHEFTWMIFQRFLLRPLKTLTPFQFIMLLMMSQHLLTKLMLMQLIY
jgi:hypothetical protein